MTAIFYYPMTPPSWLALWMVLPLGLVVAIVYKTVRTTNLRRLWLEIVQLFAYIAAGMVALGAVAWLVLAYWP